MHKKISIPDIYDFSLFTALKSSAKFVVLYRQTFLFWCAINFALLYVFKFISGGWSNSLSILWLVAYYVYWSIFIRYMLQHLPYFSLIRIFNGLVPASKIMFINIIIYIAIAIIPFVPLFMGFRDKYLEFFETYMDILKVNNNLYGKTLFYVFMLLISPYTITRPYLAWISSLVGKSRSIIDAYKKTKGHYWKFVFCAMIMSFFIFLSSYLDAIYEINITIYLMTIFVPYFNIVFMNMYKFFYKKAKKTKKSFG